MHHVVPTWHATQIERIGSKREAQGVLATQVERAREWLEGLVREAGFGTVEVAPDVSTGTPEVEIVAAAGRHGADLIVMGSRGMGGVIRPFIGGVARFVLRNAACSTLFVVERE